MLKMEKPSGFLDGDSAAAAAAVSHLGKFSCPYCSKLFSGRVGLKRHIRVHTGESPFACSECGKRFKQNGGLKSHMRIHTGEKPFDCLMCGTKFRHKGNLRRHERTCKARRPNAALFGRQVRPGQVDNHKDSSPSNLSPTSTESGYSAQSALAASLASQMHLGKPNPTWPGVVLPGSTSDDQMVDPQQLATDLSQWYAMQRLWALGALNSGYGLPNMGVGIGSGTAASTAISSSSAVSLQAPTNGTVMAPHPLSFSANGLPLFGVPPVLPFGLPFPGLPASPALPATAPQSLTMVSVAGQDYPATRSAQTNTKATPASATSGAAAPTQTSKARQFITPPSMTTRSLGSGVSSGSNAASSAPTSGSSS